MSRNFYYTYIPLFPLTLLGSGQVFATVWWSYSWKIKNFLNTIRSKCLRRPVLPFFFICYPLLLRLDILRRQLLCLPDFFFSLNQYSFNHKKNPLTTNNHKTIMASTNQLSPPPGGPSGSNRLSGWLSRRLRRKNKLRTTNAVEGQQPLSSEESSSANIISPDKTTITHSSHPRTSILKRLFRRRRARGGRNSGLEFDQIERERGFSPPRHRQPDWMRRWKDGDEGSGVSESS